MNRLVLLRKGLKMTQAELAEILGIKQSSYASIESGRNSLTDRNAELLSNKLDINKDWLLTGLGDMRAGQEDPNLDEEIAAAAKELMEEGKSIGGSVPYEFVQQLFKERETHDQIVLSQQKTIEQLTALLGNNK